MLASCPFVNKKGLPSKKRCRRYVTTELDAVYQTCPYRTKKGNLRGRKCWNWLKETLGTDG